MLWDPPLSAPQEAGFRRTANLSLACNGLPNGSIRGLMAAVQLFEHKPEDVLTDECRGKILRIIAQDPDVSQRELGISLSRADFCLRALIEKG